MTWMVDSADRGRSWQRLPRTLVRSCVAPTHVPRSAMDTSVTAHCHAAPAQLTREYQSDHRRNILTPATTRAVDPCARCTTPLTTPFHIRSAERACERSSDWRRGAAGSPDPDEFQLSRPRMRGGPIRTLEQR